MTDVHGQRSPGDTLPAQIWAAFMKAALAGTPVSDFSTRVRRQAG